MHRIIFVNYLAILLLGSVSVFGQNFYKVTYMQDTMYTFNTSAFYDTSFRKPDSVPDGKWIIFNKDSLPIYLFKTYHNCIHGEFSEYWDGILRSKGAYRMDSLWTFRFNPMDRRFRDSTWLYHGGLIWSTTLNKFVDFEYAFDFTNNTYYPNGVRKYERREPHIEVWYYPSGTMKAMTAVYDSDRDEITVEQSFDTIGNLSRIVTIRRTSMIKNKVYISGIFISSDTVEYSGTWKTKEIVDDNKHVTTIYYGNVGQEIDRERHKKKKSKNSFGW